MSDVECESLLLDDVAGKYSEDSGDEAICFADEDALLADTDETESIMYNFRTRSHNKFNKGQQPTDTDVLELGTHDAELDEEDALHKTTSSMMTVSSTTSAVPELSISCEEDEERETRFKQERQITTSLKKYTNIPDSLDDVVINYPTNNQRNQQRSFKVRGRGYYHNNNHQRHKSESKTVLINPHFKGKVTMTNNKKFNWDARERLNQNYRNQAGQTQQFNQQNHNQVVDTNWSNVQHLQVQQQQQTPPQSHFQQFLQQLPSQQIYNQPAPVPMQQQHQVPQQMLPAYQPPQQCFIQPLQDPFYSQPPQFAHSTQFNHPPPQFQPTVPQFPSDHTQYTPQSPIRMVSYSNPQFIVPQNHVIQSVDPYGQPVVGQPIQHTIPSPVQIHPNHQVRYVDVNKPKFYQASFANRRKAANIGAMRKNKKYIQTVSKNLHEVRTVQQIPDTTVKDDEDEATRQYRKLIEEQKAQREQILQQKEARRRQAAQREQVLSGPLPQQIPETVMPQQQMLPVVTNPVIVSNRFVQNQPIQRLVPINQNILNNPVRKVTPTVMKTMNPNLKVINVNSDPNFEKQHLSSFLTNRTILAKDESLLDTNVVLISNLADGTTAVKLRKMCVGIGDVKTLQMSPKERQATMQFNSVASAHAFFKKYQRTMLDLSMIQVTLKPMS